MDWEAFLAERPIAVIATVGADDVPHAVPVEVVVRDGRAYVWCHRTSQKAVNAARAGTAAIVAYKGNAFALVRGPAVLVGPEDARYRAITQAFLDKYERDEDFGNDVLIEVTPEHVAGRPR